MANGSAFQLQFDFAEGHCYTGYEDMVQKPSEHGNASAQKILGQSYSWNSEYDKAFVWYEKSANQGNMVAQFLLAKMYYEGKGCEQNLVKAREWLEKSAAQGLPGAKYYLDKMDGKTVE